MKSRIITLGIFVFILASCNNKKAVDDNVIFQAKMLDESLMNSNISLTNSNSILYKSLEGKLTDSKFAEEAKIWQPKAEMVHFLADEMNSYLNDLKKELKEDAGLKVVDGKEEFRENDLNVSAHLFEDKKGIELKNKLNEFKAKMLAIDPEIKMRFEKKFPVNTKTMPRQDGTEMPFAETYFQSVPTVSCLVILSRFQNNVKNAENQFVTFCHGKLGEVKVRFDRFGILVGQSSKYVKSGEEVEITAGIGAYSSAAAPVISINGTHVQTIDGRASYKLTTSNEGTYKVPIEIFYKDQNGVDIKSESEISYTVVRPN